MTVDPIYAVMLRMGGGDLIRELKAIEARGPGRLVASKSWANVAT